MKASILVVDDEENIREGLKLALEDENFEVLTSCDGEEAWKVINNNIVDLVITDLKMPKCDGMNLLKKVSSSYPMIPVLVTTGHGNIETAVTAMQNGAFNFITKPFDIDKIINLVNKAVIRSELKRQNDELRKEVEKLKANQKYTKLIGKSKQMINLMETINQVSNSKASVLITGESGTGKELVADAIYQLSDRSDQAMIKFNCASLSETLLESELFGHEKGAFTGATSLKKGRFELCDKGTIFLDEIGEISQNVQVKLLRVLQEKTFERVGGEKTITIDTRVISATNRDLEQEVKEHRFREDLYYRLNVVHIHVPPLRERKEDIGLLAMSFLKRFAKENKKQIQGFTSQAMSFIYKFDWPGNIRQLQNAIENSVVMTKKNVIDVDDLPSYITSNNDSSDFKIEKLTSLEEIEKQAILHTLSACKGNKSKASEILKISRKTLHRKLSEYES